MQKKIKANFLLIRKNEIKLQNLIEKIEELTCQEILASDKEFSILEKRIDNLILKRALLQETLLHLKIKQNVLIELEHGKKED